MVPLLISDIIIKNNCGPRTVPWGKTTQNWTVFAYTPWYSNIVYVYVYCVEIFAHI